MVVEELEDSAEPSRDFESELRLRQEQPRTLSQLLMLHLQLQRPSYLTT
jgi:hypothetical protein